MSHFDVITWLIESNVGWVLNTAMVNQQGQKSDLIHNERITNVWSYPEYAFLFDCWNIFVFKKCEKPKALRVSNFDEASSTQISPDVKLHLRKFRAKKLCFTGRSLCMIPSFPYLKFDEIVRWRHIVTFLEDDELSIHQQIFSGIKIISSQRIFAFFGTSSAPGRFAQFLLCLFNL